MMRGMRISAVVLAVLLGAGAAAAQPAKSMREQIVGTWDFVIAEITAANGTKTLPFGDKPKGQLIFTADGHFSQVHVSSGLPRIASNNPFVSVQSPRYVTLTLPSCLTFPFHSGHGSGIPFGTIRDRFGLNHAASVSLYRPSEMDISARSNARKVIHCIQRGFV